MTTRIIYFLIEYDQQRFVVLSYPAMGIAYLHYNNKPLEQMRDADAITVITQDVKTVPTAEMFVQLYCKIKAAKK